MKKYKKSELELFRNKFRNKQGTRVDYLAYAFLRGMPYRLQERKTHWDYQSELYEPGKIVAMNLGYDVCKIVAQTFLYQNIKIVSYEEFQELRKKFDEWCCTPLEQEEEAA